MVRRLWISLKRDCLINVRNHYLTVVVLVALLYLVGARFVIPADATVKPDVYVVDETQEQLFAQYVRQQDQREGMVEKGYLLNDPEQLMQRMHENQNSIGVVVAPGSPLPETTLYFQTHQGEKVRKLLSAAMEDELRQLYGRPYSTQPSVETQLLRNQGEATPTSLSQTLVPIFLFGDAMMIGLLFIAALIFMEKEEGTLMAYLVTPGRPFEYLLSKALSLALLAVLYALILAPAVLGTRPNYPQLLAVMVLGSIFVSLLGALVALFFENFAQFLFPGVLLSAAISLPAISYLVPSFSPWWLRWMPTYPVAFGLREAAFPTGNPDIVYCALAGLAVIDLLLLAVAGLVFKRQLARG